MRTFNFGYQKKRSELYRNIRSFFDERGYLEVFTPTLSPYLIPEPTIKVFETKFITPYSPEHSLYLIPSPEIFMKEMISNGSGSIYQISSCFRNSEQLGAVHNIEFSMLEYYTVGFDETDSIALTEEMLRKTKIEGAEDIIGSPFSIMSMDEAFWKYADMDLEKAHSIGKIREEAEKRGHIIPEDESWDDTFNRIFISAVEPNLPHTPTVIKDYPKEIECLAKDYEDRPYKKRWELYINQVEVANCYDEETDKNRTRTYYEKEWKRMNDERKGTGDVIPAADFSFSELDMKASSGVAMGLDRLLMVSLALDDISPLLSFPLSDMLSDGKNLNQNTEVNR